MKTLSAATLGAGLLLLPLAAPVLAQPAPQPTPASADQKAAAAKVRDDAHERKDRHEKHDEQHARKYDPKHETPKHETEGRHDRD